MFVYVLLFFELTGCRGQSTIPPPPPPLPLTELNKPKNIAPILPFNNAILLDTNYIRWSQQNVSILDSTDGILWSAKLNDREFGRVVKSDHHFYAVSLKFHSTNQNQSSCDLIVDVVRENGSILASSRQTTKVGYDVVSMVAEADFAYLMYQHDLSSSSRDLYVAKLDSNANMVWSTRIGKRFGTFGQRLLQIHPNGSVIAMSGHYGSIFADVLDSGSGVIKRSQQLDFKHEMDIESFIINQAHHITGIATEDYFIEAKRFNSVLMFELDTAFNVIRQQHFKTDLQDWGQDIVQRPDGNYLFLVNSEFSTQNYEEEFEMHILGITDANLQLLDQQAIEIEDDGMNSLFFLHKKDIYLYQRSPNGFNLLVLNPELQLKKTYINKEGYRHPEFLTISPDKKIWMGGSFFNVWIAELGL